MCSFIMHGLQTRKLCSINNDTTPASFHRSANKKDTRLPETSGMSTGFSAEYVLPSTGCPSNGHTASTDSKVGSDWTKEIKDRAKIASTSQLDLPRRQIVESIS